MKRTASKSRNKPGRRRLPRSLRNLLFIVFAAIAYQWFNNGELGWPSGPGQALETVSAGKESGWKLARDALERGGAARERGNAPDFDINGRVVRVADGDTLSLLSETGQQHKIRLYGIDTPELQQPHGQRARQALEAYVHQREVGIVVVETDDYGRKVGTVFLGDQNINQALVAEGHAWWYRYHAPHERHLQAAQDKARSKRLGLWSGSKPVPPWDWRRQNRGR